MILILLGQADARRIPLPDESVQCCITSPPYWGLRDYGLNGRGIGLEQSPDEYVAQIVAVFREVKRVLRKDGTVWLNLGDSYASQSNGGPAQSDKTTMTGGRKDYDLPARQLAGLKPKDLVGIPWRVAFALQADGWWLRSDIIWAKGVSFCPTYSGSVMPESVRDRCTQSYEHVFMLAKSKRYYYDATAVREANAEGTIERLSSGPVQSMADNPKMQSYRQDGRQKGYAVAAGRNLRSVWTINPKPSKLAHYAAFPPALVEPMVLAGTSAKGCCPECGRGWVRLVERVQGDNQEWAQDTNPTAKEAAIIARGDRCGHGKLNRGSKADYYANAARNITTGWRPGCDCGAELEPQPCVVLDPFGGTMTVGQVCAKHGRRFVGLDLKREYVEMGRERCADVQMEMALR